jgi:outer membrane receptor protein involved in Fe transport
VNEILPAEFALPGAARHRWQAATACLLLTLPGVHAGRVDAADDAGWKDQPLATAIARLAAAGVPVIYSSHVVRKDMRVSAPPRASAPRAVLDEILAPHGLQAREMASGRIVIVRRPADAPPPTTPERTLDRQATTMLQELEQVLVMGSRYRFLRSADADRFRFAADDLERLPDLGDDPLRAVARLPGAATSGFSAKSNIRGGEVDETLVRFDGLRLFNPFHLKDFQSLFSTIDPALVRAVDVYTGGYPVDFGDRMSGVVDVDPLVVADDPIRVASLSLFSAGLLAGDSLADGRTDWLASVRRGNLDLLFDAVDPERGKPRYFDLHARLSHRLTDDLRVRASVLRFEDDLEVSDPDLEEQAEANYVDTYAWITLDWAAGERVASRSFFGRATLDSRRDGTAEQEGISRGTLSDHRESRMLVCASDWQWQWSAAARIDFGAEYRHGSGRYRYADEVELDLLFDAPGAPATASRARSLALDPNGEHYGAYVGAEVESRASLTADLGLRYDYDSLPGEHDTWSPRVGLVWRPTERLAWRASWGRYAQSQSIQELQISDGVVEYAPPQRADHVLLGIAYQPRADLQIELELYDKHYKDLRPRFENLLNSFVLLPELKPDRIEIAAEHGRARGAELGLRGRAGSDFGWWANYSWSKAEDFIGGGSQPRSWDQRHAAGLGVGWQDERWQLDAAVSWHSGWPTTAVELVATEPLAVAHAGPRNLERLGGYFTLDLRAARHFALERSLLTVYLELTNATNRRNDCCVEYEFNDESGEPGLEIETTPYLPLLPNLGVVWEF